MTTVDHDTTHDPRPLAAAARSILSCPSAVNLVVDGVDDVLAGMDELGMQDVEGSPTFSCPPGTPLARAAARGRSALLTLESGLGAPGSPERGAVLTLAGRLVLRDREDCECCGEQRDVVALDLNFVLLARTGGRAAAGAADQQFRVPLQHFGSGDHELNRGFLQRSVEHANRCHQDELRRAVSTTTGTRLADVVGVSLTGLLPHRVEVQWVDPSGSHRRVLRFPRPAATAAELGELLRGQLHAGLC